MSDDGWPADWAERKAGAGCPLCAGLGSDSEDDFSLFVTELDSSEVRLDRNSRLPGYCIVIWKRGHVAEPTQLDPADASRYWADVLRVSKAIEEEFDPVKMNLLTLGNTVPHLHTHVLPRYPGDPAPAGPITWSDIFADEPTLPNILGDHRRRLRFRLG